MFRTSRVGRFINQNLFNIIIISIVIAFVIIIVQILNNIEKNKKGNSVLQENQTVKEEIYIPQETMISGENVNNTSSEINNEIIDNFIELCNSGNAEVAYNLLSNECKDVYFPTLDYFISNYYSQVFTTKKTYSIQSWINHDNRYTYKVRILDDMLSTGIYNNSKVIEDYYTIIKNNDETKLNINKYIDREYINYTKEENGVSIEVKYKNINKEYEEYIFNIKNNSQNRILMDSKESTNNTFVLGTNGTTYSSFIHEIDLQDLIIEGGAEKEVKIKFNKQYNPERKLEGVVFSDVILNYDEYLETENKSSYPNRIEIELYK